jgi:hypothetical protein
MKMLDRRYRVFLEKIAINVQEKMKKRIKDPILEITKNVKVIQSDTFGYCVYSFHEVQNIYNLV